MKWLALVMAVACATPARAQTAIHLPPRDTLGTPETSSAPNDTTTDGFLARVRAATARYRDRGQASLDGYRPIGGDFPGMGEHWINIGILFADRFTPAQPPILEYATIDGRPTLVGVAYALPLLAGEMPPAFPANAAWHEHSGTIESESDLLSQTMSSHGSMQGARLAMLHVWAWLPNPAGAYRSDNWALPFVRAGLVPPAGDPGAVAGRALALLSGGDTFYEQVFLDVANSSPSDSMAIHRALIAARTAAATWVDSNRHGVVTPEALDQLRSLWTDMWSTLDSSLSPGARVRLRALRDR